jgi:hypothetical protein
MARHFKVAEFLDSLAPESRGEYEGLVRRAGTTIEDLHGWLLDHGYQGGRTSVFTHRRSFEETLNGLRRSAELAKSFAEVARESGIGGVSDAALMRMQQVLMEQAFALDSGGELDPLDLQRMAGAISKVVEGSRHVAALRKEFDEQKKAAVAAAAKTAAAGGSGGDVVDKVREILGLAA